nr:MAG TPA: hypothetical protein [Caudoviricetes sp.]
MLRSLPFFALFIKGVGCVFCWFSTNYVVIMLHYSYNITFLPKTNIFLSLFS